MLLIEETYVRFGYYTDNFKPNSQRKVVRKCDGCGVEQIVPFSNRLLSCKKCSCIRNNPFKAGSKNPAHSILMKNKLADGSFISPMKNRKHTRDSRKKMSETRKGRIAIHNEEGEIKFITQEELGLYPTYKLGDGINRVGANNKFFGKQHKEESKLFGKQNPMFGKSPKHTKKIWYNNCCFRSSWEAKVAEYLDNKGIIWKYELKPIYVLVEGKEKSYIPDFYLPHENIYIEVKGRWYPGYKEKFEEARRISEVEIELWDRNKLKELGIL